MTPETKTTILDALGALVVIGTLLLVYVFLVGEGVLNFYSQAKSRTRAFRSDDWTLAL